MALVIAQLVADGQVFGMAVTAFAFGFDVLQRRCFRQHMLTTHPAGHHAVQLPCHGFVHFFSGLIQSAHAVAFLKILNLWQPRHTLFACTQTKMGSKNPNGAASSLRRNSQCLATPTSACHPNRPTEILQSVNWVETLKRCVSPPHPGQIPSWGTLRHWLRVCSALAATGRATFQQELLA